MTTKLITPPAAQPVTLSEAKAHCRVTGDLDDALIDQMIVAATEDAELELCRSLMRQTRELILDGPTFPPAFRLDWLPVLAIEALSYVDPASGLLVTLPSTEYASDDLVDVERLWFTVHPAFGKAWPDAQASPNAIRLRYRCGYSDGNEAQQQQAVPAAIKQWILLQVAAMYEHREYIVAGVSMTELPGRFVGGLLDRYRIPSV